MKTSKGHFVLAISFFFTLLQFLPTSIPESYSWNVHSKDCIQDIRCSYLWKLYLKAMNCCNFLVGVFCETRAAGNGSLATLSLNWLQISIVMQIRSQNPRLRFAKFPRENPALGPCEYPPMIHELSGGAARVWSLWTTVVRLDVYSGNTSLSGKYAIPTSWESNKM